MTEAEYFQSILYMRELAASDLMDFITTFFAYVAMSHFVGRSLSPTLAVFASIIYSSWAAVTFFSLIDLSVSIMKMTNALHDAYPGAETYSTSWESGPLIAIAMTMGPVFLSWLLSVFYLHGYVRGIAREDT